MHVPYWWLQWEDEPDDDPTEKAEYEAQFAVCDLPFAEAQGFWHFLGWDMSDGKGGELASAHWFMRQIIALVRGLDEDVVFTPDGSGKWPRLEDGDEDEDAKMQRITARLAAEVEAFQQRRSG